MRRRRRPCRSICWASQPDSSAAAARSSASGLGFNLLHERSGALVVPRHHELQRAQRAIVCVREPRVLGGRDGAKHRVFGAIRCSRARRRRVPGSRAPAQTPDRRLRPARAPFAPSRRSWNRARSPRAGTAKRLGRGLIRTMGPGPHADGRGDQQDERRARRVDAIGPGPVTHVPPAVVAEPVGELAGRAEPVMRARAAGSA